MNSNEIVRFDLIDEIGEREFGRTLRKFITDEDIDVIGDKYGLTQRERQFLYVRGGIYA